MAEANSTKDGLRGAKSLVEDTDLNDLVDLVNQAFPRLSCLRCANEQFFLVKSTSVVRLGLIKLPDDAMPKGHFDIIELICRRCGYIERHEIATLKNAAKPIKK